MPDNLIQQYLNVDCINISKNYKYYKYNIIMKQAIDRLRPTKRGEWAILRMSISICLGAFVFSYNSVILTQMAQLIKLKNNLTKQQLLYQLSIATSCFNLGALISPVLYRKFVSIFGQLRGLLIIDIVGIFAMLAQLIQLNFYILAISRFILGFIIGISTAIIPVYINSIAPPILVGKLGAFNQVLQTSGVLCAYLTGYIIEEENKQDQFRWRILLGLPILFLIIRIISLQFFYNFETLQRHIQRQQRQKLSQYCLMVYNDNTHEMIESIKQVKSFKKVSIENNLTFKRRFIIGLVVIASNQLTGTNSILFYAKQLFNKITQNNKQLTQILIVMLSIIQVVSTLLSTLVVDKFGRKNMILNGQALIGIFLLFVAMFDKLIISNYATFGTVGIIFFIFMHIFTMNFTLGPCCIIYCTQILEDITWMIITLKALSFLIALTTQYMIQSIGLGFMFLIYFFLTLIAQIFLRPRLKETKGLSCAQIYTSFGVRKKQSLLKQSHLQDQQPV